jgi:sulfite reductase (NADPH) flavoprotein alpha-component
MIGAGTGIAPFRSFLLHRQAMRSTARNWLFFGDRQRDHDFVYHDELMGMQASGLLTELSTAFSRDESTAGDPRYVQDLLSQRPGEVRDWIDSGANIYVCGAIQMARDVETVLSGILAADHDRPVDFLADLKRARRYLVDVY